MAYTITKTNGSTLITLQEEVIDSETLSNIGLIGKLSPNYGETQSNNFVHLAENFAGIEFPASPLKGMICYRTDRQGLYICIDDNVNENNVEDCWVKLPSVKFDNTEPSIATAQKGDMWFNEEDKKLYVFDSITKKWILIGPNDYLNTVVENNIGETGDTTNYIYTFDFDAHKELPETSYYAKVKVVGKEIIPTSSSFYGIHVNETAAWEIGFLINSYIVSVNNDAVVKRVIVGEPNYETIGKTSGAAVDWSVEAKINDTNNNLQIIVSGKPTVAPEPLKVQWFINLEMAKVYDNGSN